MKTILFIILFAISKLSIGQTVIKSTLSCFGNSNLNDSIQITGGQSISNTTTNSKINHGYFPLSNSFLTLIESSPTNFTIFPNPFNSSLTIKSQSNIVSINIYNLAGESVYTSPIFLNSKTISTTYLPKGFYLIKMVFNDQSSLMRKIIKN